MKKHMEKIIYAVILMSATIILYNVYIHFFHDEEHIRSYFVMHLAFIPIDILLVTLIIDEFIASRQKKAVVQKFNMIFGIWLRKAGFDIFFIIRSMIDESQKNFITDEGFENKKRTIKKLCKTEFMAHFDDNKAESLKKLLAEKSEDIFSIANNQNLHELAAAERLVMILMHIMDEFITHDDIKTMTKEEKEHISDDFSLAYQAFIALWFEYMDYLKKEFPVLFTKNKQLFAMHKNQLEK